MGTSRPLCTERAEVTVSGVRIHVVGTHHLCLSCVTSVEEVLVAVRPSAVCLEVPDISLLQTVGAVRESLAQSCDSHASKSCFERKVINVQCGANVKAQAACRSVLCESFSDEKTKCEPVSGIPHQQSTANLSLMDGAREVANPSTAIRNEEQSLVSQLKAASNKVHQISDEWKQGCVAHGKPPELEISIGSSTSCPSSTAVEMPAHKHLKVPDPSNLTSTTSKRRPTEVQTELKRKRLSGQRCDEHDFESRLARNRHSNLEMRATFDSEVCSCRQQTSKTIKPNYASLSERDAGYCMSNQATTFDAPTSKAECSAFIVASESSRQEVVARLRAFGMKLNLVSQRAFLATGLLPGSEMIAAYNWCTAADTPVYCIDTLHSLCLSQRNENMSRLILRLVCNVPGSSALVVVVGASHVSALVALLSSGSSG
ncbi:hypothetical protein DIPPA_55145 [Diplonema papillatum]|nr:hypothetical protein DIPPA_55145 [Diplonema papillatum]